MGVADILLGGRNGALGASSRYSVVPGIGVQQPGKVVEELESIEETVTAAQQEEKEGSINIITSTAMLADGEAVQAKDLDCQDSRKQQLGGHYSHVKRPFTGLKKNGQGVLSPAPFYSVDVSPAYRRAKTEESWGVERAWWVVGRPQAHERHPTGVLYSVARLHRPGRHHLRRPCVRYVGEAVWHAVFPCP
jgi:hypothetical protein